MTPERGNQTIPHGRPATGMLHLVRRVVLWVFLVGCGAALAVVLPALWVFITGSSAIYDTPTQVPSMPVAIVFGAGLQVDGSPSWMLADRVDAAAGLYEAGKVQRILMTGDNSSIGYNEVAAMKQRAIEKGVPADKVNLDYAGFRTYDSCYRARAVFGITKAVLVTQRYHLPRALFLARAFGVDAVGLVAGRDYYPRQEYYDAREAAAMSVSWYEVNVTHPLPRYLGDPVDLERQNNR
ncbi:MAG TPA: ElyC/SanA/YdcF family protein [Chloroflexota bacterium]|nr:ElyC/SanA/YdcF family protein [Chloroflexota bacterium]